MQTLKQHRHLAAGVPAHRHFKHELAYKVAAQLALIALFGILGFFPGYVLFWLVPLVTQAKLLSFLRTFAEHAHPEYLGVLRVFSKPSLLDRYLAHFGFVYHSEHHLRANVPYTALSQQSLITMPTPTSWDTVIVVYNGGHLQWHWQLLRTLLRATSQHSPSDNPAIEHERILYLPVLPR